MNATVMPPPPPSPPPSNIQRPVAMLAVSIASLAITWIAVGLRFYVRAFKIRCIGLDDWLMFLTLAVATTADSVMIMIVKLEWNQDPNALWVAGRLLSFVIGEMALYILTMLVFKLSLAVFFLRIVIQPWQRMVIYVSVGIYTFFGLVYLAFAVFQCGDPRYFLEHRIEGRCLSFDIVGALGYIHAVLNALTDWTFAILPIFVLRIAQMPRRAKYPVFGLIALATLGSISSCVRLAYIKGLKGDSDFFVNAVKIATWSIIEPGLGITAASLATLRPMFRTCIERTRTVLHPSSHSGSGREKNRRAESPNIFKGPSISIVRNLSVKHVGRRSTSCGATDDSEGPSTVTTIVGNARTVETPELQDHPSSITRAYGGMHSGRGYVRPNRAASFDSCDSYDKVSLSKSDSFRSNSALLPARPTYTPRSAGRVSPPPVRPFSPQRVPLHISTQIARPAAEPSEAEEEEEEQEEEEAEGEEQELVAISPQMRQGVTTPPPTWQAIRTAPVARYASSPTGHDRSLFYELDATRPVHHSRAWSGNVEASPRQQVSSESTRAVTLDCEFLFDQKEPQTKWYDDEV